MKNWKFWLGVLISAVLMWLALRGIDWAEVVDALRYANYWWLIPGVVVYFMGVWARAWRWHYLLGPVKKISTKKMFPIVAIGYMGNNIYPARAGELLRAYVLKRKEDVAVSASLATIIIERIFDGVVMLAFVFLNLPRLDALTADSGFIGNIRSLAIWGAVIFAVALGGFIAVAMFPAFASRIAQWLVLRLLPERFQEKTLDLINKFLGGLESLSSPANALMVFATSVVIWLFETGKYWFVMHAFPFHVDFFTLMLMNGIVNLATTLPSAPGYIGTFDGPGIAVLSAAGVAKSVATGYTLVLHAALWLPITLLGTYYMLREGISWDKDVKSLEINDGGTGENDQQAVDE